jgi:anthranilate synthase/aminodeoxychorismate synthase-like glutamine amidotransferase
MKRNVLVIDNIDSFVYNLVQYVGILDAEPIVIQNNSNFEHVANLVEEKRIEHIIISPGPKTPKEAGVSNIVIKEFYQRKKILGVCLGHQCIGYVLGAKIRRARRIRHGKTSMVEHNGKDIFKGLPNPLQATRYHSLVIDDSENTLPECIQVTARSSDDHEIMGISILNYHVYGVQFHPESILTKKGIAIIKNFLDIEI